MIKRADFSVFVKRMALCGLIALVFVGLISEGAFLIQKDADDRQPQTVELVIPPGTADRIAAGEAVSSLPEEITFVLGDTLLVRNQDDVDHQIGPVWVPPGRSASLEMEKPDRYAYACSFQPSRYLGLDVREPTTISTRLTALGLAVPPTTMFLFFYSLLLFPLNKEGEEGDPQGIAAESGKPEVEGRGG
jgi:hypothetical protein